MARPAKNPNKPGFGTKMKRRYGQFRQIYDLARGADPKVPYVALGLLVGLTLVGVLIGSVIGHPYYVGFLALLVAATLVMWYVAKRAERGAYRQIEGQPGEVGAALSSIRTGWSYQQEPVAMDAGGSRDPRQVAMVYRAVGRPGVVLIAEGPAGRAEKLLASERKRTARLIPNVPVHTFRVGAGEGEGVVRTHELLGRLNKLPKTLTKHEVPAIDKRLRSLTAVRPPVPAGMDPNRMKGKRPRL